MFILMPVIFVLGILAIALEDKIKINKAAIALFMAISLWMILMFDAYDIFVERSSPLFQEFLTQNPEMANAPLKDQFITFITNRSIVYHLGNVSETLFFVMCSMLIVDIVDKHGGFRAVTGYIRTANKRKLLWYISFAAFFFSALLDNLAAAIVIMAVLRKLVPDRTDRLKYACMVIIAANAGGSWSPIGDVTTILLWVGKNVTAMHQISHVFFPALINLLVPLTIANFWLFKKDATLRVMSEEEMADEYAPEIPNHSRRVIFVIGVLSLALVSVSLFFFCRSCCCWESCISRCFSLASADCILALRAFACFSISAFMWINFSFTSSSLFFLITSASFSASSKIVFDRVASR